RVERLAVSRLAQQPRHLAVGELDERRTAPHVGREPDDERVLLAEDPVRLRVHRDVGPPEAVDRLLRIADDRDTSRPDPALPPVVRIRAVLRQEEDDLALEGVRVLELVDEDVIEETLELAARGGIAA